MCECVCECVSSKPLGHDLLGNVMRKQSRSFFRDRLCLSGGRGGGGILGGGDLDGGEQEDRSLMATGTFCQIQVSKLQRDTRGGNGL